jgi:O-antigen/teichoic acid export membrane protein
MHPRKLVRDSVGFAATQYVVRAALMLRGVIAAGMLGPRAYGAWNALTLLMEYGTLAPLGTQQGLDQAVPARIVAGDPAPLERMKRAGLFNVLMLTLLFAVGTALYLTRSSGRIFDFWGVQGVLIALGCIALINISNYALTLLRSHGQIAGVSTWYIIQGAVGTILGLSTIPWLGAWGLLWGWVAGTLAGLTYALSQGRGQIPLVPGPSRDSLLLLRIGVPMYVYLASSLVMRSLDRIIILRFLGTEKLGYYSLAIMAMSFLLYLPDSLTYVLYPHLLRRYHTGGDRPEAIRIDVERTLRVLSVAVPALCGIAYLGARVGAMLLLPSFLPGVSAARVLWSIVLMTLGRQSLLIPAAAFITVLGGVLDYLVVRQGYDITGVAWATFSTFSVSGVLLPWLALAGLGVPVDARIRLMFKLLLPLVGSLALSYLIDRFLPLPEGPSHLARLARVGAGMVVFVLLYGALCVPLVRGIGLRQLVSEFNLPRPFGPRRQDPDAGA